MSKLRTRLALTLEGLVLLLFLIFTLLALGCVASRFVPDGHALEGLSFMPWLYLTLVAGVVGLGLLAFRRFWLAGSTVALWVLFFALQGDWISQRPVSPTGPKAFSVVTLNLQYFKQGVDKVAETIRAMDSDLFLVSEVILSRKELSDFETALQGFDVRLGKQFETGIISRLPIVWSQEVELPAHQASLSIGNRIEDQPFHPRRSFLHAKVLVGEKVLNVISVRFIAGRPLDNSLHHNLSWGRYLLETQRREVIFLRSYVEALEGPVVFGGDLNATPSSNILRKVNAFARDAYLDRHGFGKSTFPTYNRPGFRLDYIFYRPGLAVTDAAVLPLVTSDHFPVHAAFAFGN